MNTVYKRKFLPKILLCHRLVCRKHKFLNNAVCIVAFILFNLNRLSLLIKCNLALREIKINRTSLKSSLTKYVSEFVHKFKHRNEIFILFSLLLILQFNYLVYTCIWHSSVNIYNTFFYTVFNDFTFFIYVHQAWKCKSVYSLIKWTYSVW